MLLDQGYDLINTRLDLGLERFGLLLKLSIGEIRDLARVHTSDAIEALRGIAVDLTAPASARVATSEALLNRAWGRPSLAISAEGEAEPVELVVRWAGS